ncbi:hypothetical protein [Frankia gtarii]|nr:hypothetical protein [Frankia gtarii]
MSLNLRRGAPDAHWPALAELIGTVEPDLLCVQSEKCKRPTAGTTTAWG